LIRFNNALNYLDAWFDTPDGSGYDSSDEETTGRLVPSARTPVVPSDGGMTSNSVSFALAVSPADVPVLTDPAPGTLIETPITDSSIASG